LNPGADLGYDGEMKTRTWLVVGLSLALGGSAAAQPAPAATKKAPAARPPAKKGAKAAPKVDLSPTITALASASVDDAVKAAETLGASTDPAAHEALLDALAFGLPASVAIAAIQALALRPAPPDVVSLRRYAGHQNRSVRAAAYTALALYPSPAAQQVLLAGLRDLDGGVRAAAAAAAAKGHVRDSVPPLLELLARNEEAAAKALAAMADAELARKLADQLGKLPDAILAQTLGMVLRRADFGPDPARVELVRAIGKIQDAAAVGALTEYLDATPKNPPRPSRVEAQKTVEALLGGGK
jgi:HEAT repeat protein